MTQQEFISDVRNRMAWIEGRLRNIEEGSPFSNEITDIEMEIGGMTADIKDRRQTIKEERLAGLFENMIQRRFKGNDDIPF